MDAPWQREQITLDSIIDQVSDDVPNIDNTLVENAVRELLNTPEWYYLLKCSEMGYALVHKYFVQDVEKYLSQ